MRFLKRCGLVLVSVALATLLAVPASALVPRLKNVTLSCTDGTRLNLSLDAAALSALTKSVAAINLYPAGSPPLACSLTQSTSLSTSSTLQASSGNPVKDYAVGGGQVVPLGFDANSSCTGPAVVNFAFSAHVNAGTQTTGVGGTFNLSIPKSQSTPSCSAGHLVAKVNCLDVGSFGSNIAFLRADVTKSSGSFASDYTANSDEIAAFAVDDAPFDYLGWDKPTSTLPCNGASVAQQIMNGNINIHDASA
jgi:hypothetical protein